MSPLIFFEITDQCNHTCFYCCKDFRKRFNHTFERDALDHILALPKSGLVISGGEPSLVGSNVFYVLEQADVPVTINTNLTGWTPEELRSLAGKAYFNVSVPSMNEEEYASITGANTFQRFLKNLEAVPKEARIGIAVHGRNRAGIGQTVAQLAIRGFRRFMLQPVYGSASRKEDIQASMQAIEEVYKRNRHLDIRFMSPCGSAQVPATHACDAGRGRLVILSNGDFVPCACRKMAVLGNLFAPDFDFGAVREAGAAFYQSFPPAQRPLCKGYL